MRFLVKGAIAFPEDQPQLRLRPQDAISRRFLGPFFTWVAAPDVVRSASSLLSSEEQKQILPGLGLRRFKGWNPRGTGQKEGHCVSTCWKSRGLASFLIIHGLPWLDLHFGELFKEQTRRQMVGAGSLSQILVCFSLLFPLSIGTKLLQDSNLAR